MSRTVSKYFPLIIIAISCYLYYYMSWYCSRGDMTWTSSAYYNSLLDAFLHGRLNISPFNSLNDLSVFQNKWYMYWGPAPALFILPFYLVYRIPTSDVWYTLSAGVVNIVLFYLSVLELNKKFDLKLSNFSKIFLFLSFAFVSPNFYLSLNGRIWHTSQVIAVTYLLGFLLFYLKFLNTKKVLNIALSSAFLGLAFLTRPTLIVYSLLFLPFFTFYQKDKKTLIASFLTAGFILFLSLVFFFGYNYARFGNIFETGILYQLGNDRFLNDLHTKNYYSPQFFGHNFYYYFINPFGLNPDLSNFLINKVVLIDFEGNSMFLVYPVLFFLPWVFSKKFFKDPDSRIFIATGLYVGLIILMSLLFFFGTGWVQFGLRYLFDAIPILYLLLAFAVGKVPASLKISVLFYGLLVGFLGSIAFYFY